MVIESKRKNITYMAFFIPQIWIIIRWGREMEGIEGYGIKQFLRDWLFAIFPHFNVHCKLYNLVVYHLLFPVWFFKAHKTLKSANLINPVHFEIVRHTC